jgi:hypothetical protein
LTQPVEAVFGGDSGARVLGRARRAKAVRDKIHDNFFALPRHPLKRDKTRPNSACRSQVAPETKLSLKPKHLGVTVADYRGRPGAARGGIWV